MTKSNVANINKYKKRKKRAGSIRWVLYIVFFLACILAGYFFSQSPFFFVKEINVTGNSVIAKERIVELSQFHLGDNLCLLDTKTAKSWIKMEPYIDSVEVKKRYPNKINISVTERQAMACIAYEKGYLEIDANGYVLRTVRVVDKIPEILITSVADLPLGALPGVKIEGESIEVVLGILQQVDLHDNQYISEIDVANPQKIKVYTKDNVEIRVGDNSTFKDKLNLANKIIDDRRENNKIAAIQYIDVSIMEKPVIYYYN